MLPGVLSKEKPVPDALTRPVLANVLEDPRPGDTLVVWRLDRLTRSLRHVIDTVTALAERGAGRRDTVLAAAGLSATG